MEKISRTLKTGHVASVAVFRAEEMTERGTRRSYEAARIAGEAGCEAWEIRQAHPVAGPDWVCERGTVRAPLRTTAAAAATGARDDRWDGGRA